MIKHFISRPIAVFMAFTAFFILGIVTYLNIPVSLLPDIAIPEITVQVTGKNASARELENTVVTPIRQQLLQIGKLRDIRSETRDGSGIVRLSFEYGTDTDLAFIEVNEKIDAAMNYIPREIDRPRVVKASATDIPVFNLNLTLKNDQPFEDTNQQDFLQLSELAETVIKRRIEQLPEVSMVDMTGLVNKQVLIAPDMDLLQFTGITLSDIESALSSNNIEAGSMTVRDGYYEYNIRFSSVVRTVEDIRNIFIRKNDKLYQLKDLAAINLIPEKEKGLAFYNGKQSVTLSVIKQADENMGDMQEALEHVILKLEEAYPEIGFDISQSQTELLNYTISNLQQNLILAFIFICIVSILFMKDVKSPLVIGISMFVSLVISLLFFYLFHVSLNVVSLTGLILALGMMIDNSIIVTDNIEQYRQRGLSLDAACVKGTTEVVAPMLSSALTTIAVFIPLIFLSGIAGAIFFDQAFSVTVGLLVSYVTGIMLLPVLYKMVHSIKRPSFIKAREKKEEENGDDINPVEKVYHYIMNWMFAHKAFAVVLMIIVFPLCFLLFTVIPKEKMPDISQDELIVTIEWNENIHLDENKDRTAHFIQAIQQDIVESSALVAQQQFLLNRDREMTSSETEVYLRIKNTEDIDFLQSRVNEYFEENFPEALISFAPAGTIFEKIFVTGEPDVVLECYAKDRNDNLSAETIHLFENHLRQITGEVPKGISFQEQVNIFVDREKLLLYNVDYNQVYNTLRTAFKENEFTTLRSYQQYLPIVIGSESHDIDYIIRNTLIQTNADDKGETYQLPLSTFITTAVAEDRKTIVAGKSGEYVPFEFSDIDHPEELIAKIREDQTYTSMWDIDFSGSFFSNKKMISELMIILLISILLMYFILAAQFESFLQPFIVLLEIPIDIAAALGLLIVLGHTLNLMSAIGIIVTCGIIINDSILKIDVMNQLRKEGMPLMKAIHEAGHRRLKAIIMTSLTTIVCMVPLLFSNDMGSELEKPLAIATIGGMVIGTLVSLFIIPLVYWWIYRKDDLNRL